MYILVLIFSSYSLPIECPSYEDIRGGKNLMLKSIVTLQCVFRHDPSKKRPPKFSNYLHAEVLLEYNNK